MVFGFGLFGNGTSVPSANGSDRIEKDFQFDDIIKDTMKDFEKMTEESQFKVDENEEKVEKLEENDQIEAEVGTEIDGLEASSSLKILAEKKELNVELFKILARIIPIFWILAYYLTFYNPKEVSSKYFGLYFTGVSLIAIFAEKNPNLSIRLNNQQVIGQMEFFDLLLKFIFLNFVTLFSSAREQIGTGSPSFLFLSMLVFFICVLIETVPVVYNMVLVDLIWQNVNIPIWKATRGPEMSELYELHRKFAEPHLYFVKKLRSNVLMMVSSFYILFSDFAQCPIIYLSLLLMVILFFNEITQSVIYEHELDPDVKESKCPVSLSMLRKVTGKIAEMVEELMQAPENPPEPEPSGNEDEIFNDILPDQTN